MFIFFSKGRVSVKVFFMFEAVAFVILSSFFILTYILFHTVMLYVISMPQSSSSSFVFIYIIEKVGIFNFLIYRYMIFFISLLYIHF